MLIIISQVSVHIKNQKGDLEACDFFGMGGCIKRGASLRLEHLPGTSLLYLSSSSFLEDVIFINAFIFCFSLLNLLHSNLEYLGENDGVHLNPH